MMEHLVFRLYGPMASWGEVSPGERRGSADHPTKSAVLGIVAASLGLSRERDADHLALSEGLGFAVRTDTVGRAERDYHTTQTGSSRGSLTRREEIDPRLGKVLTMLSTRVYRTDEAWTVALWSREADPGVALDEIRRRLEEPRFVLYLGRKSCPPALPLAPQIVRTRTLREALESPRPSDQEFLLWLRWSRPSAVYFDEHPAPGFEVGQGVLRRDEVRSRVRWEFSQRTEYRALPSDGPSSRSG